MFWWGLGIFALVAPFLLYGLFRWASSDPGVDRELAKERFRTEQELRGLRRSGGSDLLSPPAPTKSDPPDAHGLPADTFTR
jgi:hypothetical protein